VQNVANLLLVDLHVCVVYVCIMCYSTPMTLPNGKIHTQVCNYHQRQASHKQANGKSFCVRISCFVPVFLSFSFFSLSFPFPTLAFAFICYEYEINLTIFHIKINIHFFDEGWMGKKTPASD
jgi:hypothetical protein